MGDLWYYGNRNPGRGGGGGRSRGGGMRNQVAEGRAARNRYRAQQSERRFNATARRFGGGAG